MDHIQLQKRMRLKDIKLLEHLGSVLCFVSTTEHAWIIFSTFFMGNVTTICTASITKARKVIV